MLWDGALLKTMSREGQLLRMLIVEDSEADAELLLHELRRGGYNPDWERVETEAAMRRSLQRREWDIVFCDFTLPAFDAPGAIRTLRETGNDLPAIIVSGTVGDEAAVEAMRYGANDYLLKDNLARLIPAVRRELREAEARRAGRLSEAKKHHAEEALRLSEERHRVLFEYNPIPMWVYDRTTLRCLEVNQAALDYYGYSRAEFLALPVLALQPDEDKPAALESMGDRRNDAPLTRGVWRQRKKDGTLFFADVVTQPITYLGVQARIAQALDVTERKATEEALVRIKTAVECASDAIAIADPVGASSYHNRAFVEMFGFTPEELNEAGGVRALFQRPETAAAAFAAVAESDGWAGNAHLSTRSAKTMDLFLRANAVRNAAGENVATIVVCTDLRKQKQAAQKIAEQAELLDQAQDAIMVKDLRGTVRYWNKGAERIFGWTAAEALQRRVQEFMNRDPASHEEAMADLLRQGAWSGELTRTTKDGREVLIEARWTLVRDEHGDPKSVLAIETDITEKKKIEAQFFRAQRMESIGTLAGGIAHDLNNVLGPIIMAVDLLKLRIRESSDVELLETIEVSAQRGAEMVRQVLSFARGMDGKRVLLQPAQLLQQVRKFTRETFPKSIDVQLATGEGTWNLHGDPTQLHQVLLNLALNARDAMPRGGELRIGARNETIDGQLAVSRPEARPGPYILFEVTDTGTGISPEVIEKIFEPFFTTKDIGQGTGLGLSTALAIIRSHGGFVTVKSAPGSGTTFQVHLPAALASKETAGKDEIGDLPHGEGECILVIDDEASVRTVTSRTLTAFGYRVLTAADGAEGVAEYVRRREEIALVLTDMMMPVMDGLATIRALIAINPEVKIVAASGFSSKGAEVAGVQAGMKAFLAKPYTAAELLQTLHGLLHPPASDVESLSEN